MPVILHYFDCRSRGQALRFALVASGVDFEDRRIPIEALPRWREKARDESLGGPFASLPLLDWDDFRVAQTLAIASYLAEKLPAQDRPRTPEERAHQQMVIDAAHLDMQVPYSGLMWLAADAPDAKLLGVARGLLEALTLKLHQLEVVHGSRGEVGAFFGGLQPSMADYFVHESLDRACKVFGAVFEEKLAFAPRLARLRSMLESDPEIVSYVAAGGVPTNVTASPTESAIRARLTALDLRSS